MKDNKDILDHIKVIEVETPKAEYFEKLAHQISQKKTKIVPMYRKPLFWTAIAAAIVVSILIFKPQSSIVEKDVLVALNEIPDTSIEEYILDNIEEFDTDLIVDYVNEEQLEVDPILTIQEESAIEQSSPTINFENVDLEDIIDYFDANSIDYTDIDEDSFI